MVVIRVGFTLTALPAAIYFRWEARTSLETLPDLRQQMLQGVVLVPPAGSRVSRAAAQ
ncbi:MAG TPA: hypothetical protein VN428_17345 [Bryobacteraceae bacterium]|nr:hypothetical protein [Bryobacteraceae bacterium]